MTLYFKHEDGSTIPFPFKTPLGVSREVVRELSHDKKVGLLKYRLKQLGWSPEQIDKAMEEIEANLRNPRLHLLIHQLEA